MSLTAIVFVFIFIGGLCAALFRKPIYGLYNYVAVFYLHPPDRWWGGALPGIRWSLIAAVVTLIAVWRMESNPGRDSWLSSSAAKILLIFTIWFWFQQIWALDSTLHFTAAILFTKYVVLFFLIYKLLDSREAMWGFAAVNIAGCAYLGWLILNAPMGRLDGIGGPGIDSANTLSAHLLTGLIVASTLVLRGPVWLRVLALVSVPFIANGIVQTQTRGALFGLVGGGLALLYLMPKVNRKLLYVLGMLSCVILVQTVPDNFLQRMDTIVTAVESVTGMDLVDNDNSDATIDNSSASRVVLFAAQWEMFKKYPFGVGHRGTVALSSRYLSAEYLDRGGRSSHNTFMTALVEQGIIGAMLFIGLIIWVFRSCARLKRLDANGLLPDFGILRAAAGGAMISILVAGNFVDLLKSEAQVWYIALLAVLWDVARHSLAANESGTAKTVEKSTPL